MSFDGDTSFYEKEEPLQSVDEELKKQIENIKNVIYNKIVLGSMPNDSKESQNTDNALYYEHIMRRLCLDLDPSIRVSNMAPLDELPQINIRIKELKNDKEIASLIDSLIHTYRSLAKSENAKYNSSYIQQALITFPWPYSSEDDE